MKRVSFDELVVHLRGTLAALPDQRQGQNRSYAMADFGLSAFSVFFTQSPSFLAHQRTMQQARGHHNAQSFFHVQQIPCDNQIRQMLDPVPPATLFPVSVTRLPRVTGVKVPSPCPRQNKLVTAVFWPRVTNRSRHPSLSKSPQTG